MKNEEMLNLKLPKWPQMIVTGTPVSEEQALEIIRRTDEFFNYPIGNNRDFVVKAIDALKMPKRKKNRGVGPIMEYWDEMAEWQKKWGYIHTEYVTNSWISCIFLGGPHGWCHPNGQIGYADNVGKWPTVEEIFKEWETLAAEFKFIELEVTLMNGEDFEDFTDPVVSMLIRDGVVKLVDPKERNLHREFGRKKEPPRDNEKCAGILSNPALENALPLDLLRKWGDQIFGGSEHGQHP